MLGGLLLAVPDWARLSIRASVLPVVRHSRRTVLMPRPAAMPKEEGSKTEELSTSKCLPLSPQERTWDPTNDPGGKSRQSRDRSV